MMFAAAVFTQPFAQVTVSVNEGERYQTIEGFGACGMDLQAWKERSGPFLVDVNLDSVGFYDTVISRLGATMLRIYFDGRLEQTPGVIDHPEILSSTYRNVRKFKAAAERQDEPLRFITTSWSPPGWTKVIGTVPCGHAAAPNCLTDECRLKDGMEPAVADFLVRYVQLLKDSADIVPYALSPQNESAFREPYASCVYCPIGYANLIKAVGGRFRQEGMQMRLYGAEHAAWAFPYFERAVRADAEALGYMHAWALHGYVDDIEPDTGSYNGSTPTDKPLWMTETSGSHYGATLRDWSGAMVAGKVMLTYLRDAKATVWCWWTLHKSTTEPIETTDATYWIMINGQFTDRAYVTSHFSRYIRPGARQIRSTVTGADSLRAVAFYHDVNECMSIVFLNRGPAVTISGGIQGSGIPATFERITSTSSVKLDRSTVAGNEDIALPAQSITTLVAGAYRGTGAVKAIERPVAQAQRVNTPASAARVEILTLDGRRVDMVDARSSRSLERLPAGIYVRAFVDAHGRVVSSSRLTVSGR